MSQDGEKFRLVFEPEGDGPPATVRVRRLLKYARRQLGLRCVSAAAPEATSRAAEVAAVTSRHLQAFRGETERLAAAAADGVRQARAQHDHQLDELIQVARQAAGDGEVRS